MSPTQKDRKVRSNPGRTFPSGDGGANEPPSFADAIAAALHREFGGSPASVKVVVRLTRANHRAVKNWFDAKNGPNGENLITLLKCSDEVLETVLLLAGRAELVTAKKFVGAREKLREMLAMIDQLETR